MKKSTILWFVLAFVVMAVVMGQIYKAGISRPPLKYSQFNDVLVDFINNLKMKDVGISIRGRGPFDWDNESDLGQEWNSDWQADVADENFIVYYHKDKDAVWQGRARQILKEANDAIPAFVDFMGHYFYASDMNGRRLAIYLAESESVYAATAGELLGDSRYRGEGTSGLTFTEIGPLGCLTRGILLHPEIFGLWAKWNGERYPVEVLRHEMHHYVFFSSLNYAKDVRHYKWVSEGMAELFARSARGLCVSHPDSIEIIKHDCLLTAEFQGDTNPEYWAGESFLAFLEKMVGPKVFREVVRLTYENSTSDLLSDSLLLGKMTEGADMISFLSPEAAAAAKVLRTMQQMDQKAGGDVLATLLHQAWIASLQGVELTALENMEKLQNVDVENLLQSVPVDPIVTNLLGN